jgi:methylmalonyl-CoA/ethylmalonyl-CoA epimerase
MTVSSPSATDGLLLVCSIGRLVYINNSLRQCAVDPAKTWLTMKLNLSQIGQIRIGVADIDRSEGFFETVIGLRKLFRVGNMAYFDCAGVRLWLDQTADANQVAQTSVIYFRCADLGLTVTELARRGVAFTHPAHLVAPLEDHDLWMAFFEDPDGHTLAVMSEVSKGFDPIQRKVAS